MSTTEQPQPANPNKALWEKGDFTRIAATMRASGEALVGRLGITKGLDVLDLGCGDGTTAIPAAGWARTCSASTSPRTWWRPATPAHTSLGLSNCRFQEGDATHLDELADDSFDLVVSIFGAMFAPKPVDVAKEIVRVTRPGGRIVMGNWIPNDPTLVAQILRISAAYSPPPPGGIRQPDDVGRRGHRGRAVRAAGVPAERVSSSATPTPSIARDAAAARSPSSGSTTGRR